MYIVQLLEQNITEGVARFPTVDNEHTWEFNFKTDKEARNFLKNAEKIETEEGYKIEMLSTAEIGIALQKPEPLTWILVYDESENPVGSNFYKKIAYPHVLLFIEEMHHKEGAVPKIE